MRVTAERPLTTLAYRSVSSSFPEGLCVHELIEAQIAVTPDAVALQFHGGALTYRELDERSSRLANYLKHQGVSAESLVGVCLERSFDLWITLLAIFKAGAAYIPLDPSFPAERLDYMLQDSSATVLIAGELQAQRFLNYAGTLLVLEQRANEIGLASEVRPPCLTGPDDLAYVTYTSGSTGKPKGVMISHRSVVNFLHSMVSEPGAAREDVLLAISTFSFDISVLEMFLMLIVGGSIVIADAETVIDARRLMKLLSSYGVTLMQATPSTWRLLIAGGWTGTKNLKALCGGESMSRDLAEALLKRVDSLWNMYGPTETTVWSLIAQVESGTGSVPIGRPIANTTVYVFDEEGRPVSPGVTGNLYLGGAGLARGYWNRPELTAHSFVANPLPECGGERIYRTGDLACHRNDGQLEWKGRRDGQVKIDGHRLELEEIESVLRQHAGIANAVAVFQADRPDSLQAGRLRAYIVPARHQNLSSPEVRRHAQMFLPDYMVPSGYCFVETLPLTPNGKLDRNALPPFDLASKEESARERVAPETPVEVALLRCFEQLLLTGPIGVTDNFFELGGSSLLAAQLVIRIQREMGHEIPTATLFQAPTVRELASQLRDRTYLKAWSKIVELRKGDGLNNAPLFCIHWLDAKLVTFYQIASLLRTGRPVYGLQPGDLDSSGAPSHTIRDIAAVYLEEIRALYPHGPYNLTGSCLGGVVAFEIAQQLLAAGEKTDLLLLIDAYMPGPLEFLHQRAAPVEWLDRYFGEFLLSPAAAVKRWVHETATRLSRTAGQKDSLSRASDHLKKLSEEAEANYRPQPYPGKVTLLICSDGPFRSYEDRRLGWSAVAEGGFEVNVIPGNHSTMEKEPNLTILADRFQRCFDRLNFQNDKD